MGGITGSRVTLGEIDNVDPGLFTILGDAAKVYVLRVKEDYNVEQVVLPFDRDGSNRKVLFTGEGVNSSGPQHLTWSAASVDSARNNGTALVYNGNIWLIDSGTGIARQATGDGLTSLVDWR